MWKGANRYLLKQINKGTKKWRIFNIKPSDHDVGMFEQHPPPPHPQEIFLIKLGKLQNTVPLSDVPLCLLINNN